MHVYNIVLVLLINWHCYAFKVKNASYNKKKSSSSSMSVSSDISDAFLDSYQLINKYHYKAEKHLVVTGDGYIVTLFRIRQKGPPVLMLHGIADSSDSWLLLGPDESLALMLADAGFDVWLLNSRGNKYSKSHVNKFYGKDYWNFSFEEIGNSDLAASIDRILFMRKRSKLSFVGFSQGTTSFLSLCSLMPEYNSKIDLAILLAPVAWIHGTQYQYSISILAKLLSNYLDTLVPVFDALGINELYRWNPVLNNFHAEVCKEGEPAKLLCDLEFLFNFGITNSSNISPEKYPVIASHMPAGTSTKSFVHYLQIYRSGKFARYDYGSRLNEMIYNKSKPPSYDISLVTVPIVMYTSDKDWFSGKENARNLRNQLSNIKKHVKFNESLDFTHLEFVYGSRVRTLVNNHVVNDLLESRNIL